MQKFSTLDDAIDLATLAHKKQRDKAGLAYIKHPERVLAAVQAQGAMPYVQIAAILHDVPEDTTYSHDVLRALGFSEAVIKLTKLLDRNHSKAIVYDVGKDQTGPEHTWPQYAQYIAHHSIDEFYYWQILNNPDAKMIKLADIADNLQPWRLNYLDDETQKRLREKYAFALSILQPSIGNQGFIN